MSEGLCQRNCEPDSLSISSCTRKLGFEGLPPENVEATPFKTSENAVYKTAKEKLITQFGFIYF